MPGATHASRAGSGGSSARPSGSPAATSTSRSWTRAQDELGELAAAFERMRVRLDDARPRAPRVHRQRVPRAAHAALLAGRLPRADGGRGARRGDAAGVPRRRCASRSTGWRSSPPTCSTSPASTPAACASSTSRSTSAQSRELVGEEFGPRRGAQDACARGRCRRPSDRPGRRAARAPGVPRARRQRARAHAAGIEGDVCARTPTASAPTSRSRTTGRASRPSMRRTSSTASTARRAASPRAAGSGSRSRASSPTFMDGDVELESEPGRTVVRGRAGAAPTSVASQPWASAFPRENGASLPCGDATRRPCRRRARGSSCSARPLSCSSAR